MRKTLVSVLFLLARVFLSRGMRLGQWCQNKAILLLTGVRSHRE
jgi:hypothetical protein